jgi:hypothetical protein
MIALLPLGSVLGGGASPSIESNADGSITLTVTQGQSVFIDDGSGPAVVLTADGVALAISAAVAQVKAELMGELQQVSVASLQICFT